LIEGSTPRPTSFKSYVSSADHETDVVVIGAGQAGLSAAYFLRRAGLANDSGFVVFDHGKRAGGAWQYRWRSLVLDKVHGLYDLPGMTLGTADRSRPASEVVSEYFDRFEHTYDLPVRRPVEVLSVSRGPDDRLLVASATETWAARAVISATGTWDRPFWPRYPGQGSFRGRQLHTAQYRGPGEFAGLRVVVVGGGASGTQHLMELAGVGARTTWVTRRPPVFVDGPFDAEIGRHAVSLVEERVRQGLPPGSVVSVTGLPRTTAIEEARALGVLDRLPMFDRITPDGVAWNDGRRVAADVILWATGFRAALSHLAPLRLREPGGGIRLEGTRVAKDPRIHLIGYGGSASTIGANRAGRAAAREITGLLGIRRGSAAHRQHA